MNEKNKRQSGNRYKYRSTIARNKAKSIWIWSLIGAVFIILIVVFIYLNSNVSPVNPQHFSSQGHIHNPSIVPTFKYNSNPPTSGPHDEIFPSRFIMDSPLEKARLIHMLEHGNIVIAYNGLPNNELTQLKDWVNEKNAKLNQNDLKIIAEKGDIVFLTSWPELKVDSITVLAWTRLYPMEAFSSTKLNEFVTKWQKNVANLQQ